MRLDARAQQSQFAIGMKMAEEIFWSEIAMATQ
jgi:hypothetical protein